MTSSWNNCISDIDECGIEDDDCSEFADCKNTEPGFECSCMTGFEGDGKKCEGI